MRVALVVETLRVVVGELRPEGLVGELHDLAGRAATRGRVGRLALDALGVSAGAGAAVAVVVAVVDRRVGGVPRSGAAGRDRVAHRRGARSDHLGHDAAHLVGRGAVPRDLQNGVDRDRAAENGFDHVGVHRREAVVCADHVARREVQVARDLVEVGLRAVLLRRTNALHREFVRLLIGHHLAERVGDRHHAPHLLRVLRPRRLRLERGHPVRTVLGANGRDDATERRDVAVAAQALVQEAHPHGAVAPLDDREHVADRRDDRVLQLPVGEQRREAVEVVRAPGLGLVGREELVGVRDEFREFAVRAFVDQFLRRRSGGRVEAHHDHLEGVDLLRRREPTLRDVTEVRLSHDVLVLLCPFIRSDRRDSFIAVRDFFCPHHFCVRASRVEHAAHHRADRNPLLLRDQHVRLAFATRDQNVSVRGREHPDRLRNARLVLALLRNGARVRVVGGARQLRLLAVVDRHRDARATVAAVMVDREVRDDAIDPRPERCAPVELVEVPPHAEKRLLYDIVRSLTVATRAERHCASTRRVSPHQFRKRSAIASTRAIYEFTVDQRPLRRLRNSTHAPRCRTRCNTMQQKAWR